MDYFTNDGVFWLPDRADRHVPGTLTFDPDGLALRVHDSLHPPEIVEGKTSGTFGLQKTVPVVHGRLYDGPEVTLLQSSGTSMAIPFSEITETWRVDFVLSGGHVTADSFDQARFDFDALMPWARPPGIATDGATPNTVQADLTTTSLIETVTTTGLEVRLLTGAEGKWDHSRVHLDQWCQFETTGDLRPIRGIIKEWVRPLHDLLIVSLGRPVRLTSLSVRPPEAGSRDSRLIVSFAAVQPQPRTPPTQAEIDNYTAPTLVTRSSSPNEAGQMVTAWYDVCERFPNVVALFCGPYQAPFMYSEHRYASTIQAAEALAIKLYTSREKTPADHAERIEAVTTALANSGLDENIVDWATAVLRGRNDKSLRTLIEELACGTGGIGDQILQAVPKFPRDVAEARVGVAHGAAHGTDAVRRYWLGETLSWIVRVQLLVEAGLQLDDLALRAVHKPGFHRALDRLSDTS